MIVCGTNDNSLRGHLLRESELALPKATSADPAAKETRKHTQKILKSNENIDLHKISKPSKSRSQTFAKATKIIKKCKFCENSHHHGKCPAYRKVCHNCNRKNHFKKCCPRNRKTLHKFEQTETESPSADEHEFFLNMIDLPKNPENLANISQIKNELSDWNITLSSNGTRISYKIDAGAQCNVFPVKSLENISPKPHFQPVNVKLLAYNGSKIPVIGKCSLTLAHKNNSFKVSFIVVESNSVPILGLKTSKHLQLIKRICRIETSIEMYCFGEIGTLNTTHHTEVKDNVKPVVTHVREVLHALKAKLEKQLKRMVDLDII